MKWDIHDHRSTSVTYENEILSFTLDDGRILKFHLINENMFECFIYNVKRNGDEVRKTKSLKKFMRKINRDHNELEFLYVYEGYQSYIIECMLWFDEPPYSKECNLKFLCDNVQITK